MSHSMPLLSLLSLLAGLLAVLAESNVCINYTQVGNDVVAALYPFAEALGIDLYSQGNGTSQDGDCKDDSTLPVPLVCGSQLLSPLWERVSSKTCITSQLDGVCNTFIRLSDTRALLFRALTRKDGTIEIQSFLEGDTKQLGSFQLNGISLNECAPSNMILNERLIALPVECLEAGTACLVLQRISQCALTCDGDDNEDEVFSVCSTPCVNSTACKDALTKTGFGGSEFVDLPNQLRTKCVCQYGQEDVFNRNRIEDDNCIYLPEGFADNAFN